MGWGILLDPPVSTGKLLGIGLLAGLIVVVVYARTAGGTRRFVRPALIAMRLAVLATLLVILLRPMVLAPHDEVRDKPIFSVLVDTSQSMNTRDVGSQSRYEAVVATLGSKKGSSLLTKLAGDYEIRTYAFDQDLRRTALRYLAGVERAEGRETRISAALTKAVEGGTANRTRGVLLISDGRSSEADPQSNMRSAARYLRALKVPVWTVPVGTASETKDLHLLARVNSSFLLANQPASIHVSLTGAGYADWNATLHLYREEERVGSKQVTLENGHAETRFAILEEHRGVFQYRVEAEPLPGENDTDNNRRSIIARVIDEKTRILVVEARPHWDSKFLLRTLRADMNVEVTSVFYINPNKSFAVVEKMSDDNMLQKTVTPGVRMPRTREELLKYDCIFLGKDMDEVFTSDELRALQEFVADGGGSIVFFRGKPYSRANAELAQVEPVQWGAGALADLRFELTEQGRSNPIFDYGSHVGDSDVIIRELPSMTSVTRVAGEKALAVVLARAATGRRGEPIATVAYHRYGKGKVMSIGAAGLWQWGFLPQRMEQYDDIYQRFWSQMVRWLVSGSEFLPGREISFQIDKSMYRPGEVIRMAVSAKLVEHSDYRPRIAVTQPDGGAIQLTPTRREDNTATYEAMFTPQQEGEYEAVLHNNIGQPQKDLIRFTVYDDSIEARCIQADRDMLNVISEVTGGELCELDELEALPEKVDVFETLTRERIKPKDAWDRLGVFGALIGLLAVEWLLRRASGLL